MAATLALTSAVDYLPTHASYIESDETQVPPWGLFGYDGSSHPMGYGEALQINGDLEVPQCRGKT